MPTRELLSPGHRAQLLSLPAEMSEQMLARYYTLSSEDLAGIRRHRRPHNKLGFAVQLAYLRFPGRTWTASEEVSPLILSYITNQLKVNPMGMVQCSCLAKLMRMSDIASEPLMDTSLHLASTISAMLCKKCATISVGTHGSQFIPNMKGNGTP